MPELKLPARKRYYRWAQLQWQPQWYREAQAWLAEVFDSHRHAGPQSNPSLEDLKEVMESLAADLAWEHWRNWFAPLGAIEGCWLDTVVHMANAHTPRGSAWLRVQSQVRGLSQARHSAYSLNDLSPVVSHYAWLDKIHSDPVIWQDGATLLALGRMGRYYPWEILGLTQAYTQLCGGLFGFPAGLETSSAAGDFASIVQPINQILLMKPLSSEASKRVRRGKDFFLNRTTAWIHAWQAHRELKRDLRRQVLSIFRQKACYGKGLHHRVKWQGRSLESWFSELREGSGERFLKAFLESPFVDLECPDDSRFFQRSIAFEGPMFGVFNKQETKIIKQWLLSERRSCLKGPASSSKSITSPAIAARRVAKISSKTNKTGSIPELYLHLLTGKNFPQCLDQAHFYVEKILRGARKKARQSQFHYSPLVLKQTIDGWYQNAHRSVPKAAAIPKLSREAYVWGIEQLAPAILIDGAWLQYSALVARQYPAIGDNLWAIFRDELGAGKVRQNHANVYRQLLAELSIELPPFDSKAFINHPGFINGAFDLPAFLLAIGQLPGAFLPELLGLNLAIELSGLGGTYQTLAEELTYWGIDPAIVRLHQSIDNLACGHAARARETVIAYLDAFAPAGDGVVQAQWLRIWTGYHALQTASKHFARRMMVLWWWRFGWPDKRTVLKNKIPVFSKIGQGG